MRPSFLLAGIGSFAALGCTNGSHNPGDAFLTLDKNAEKPVNIVLFYLDDSGFADFSFNGAVGYTTPNVDRMAMNGLRFTNYYTAQPISGGLRVPCIFYMPGHIREGVCNDLISSIDFLPTLASPANWGARRSPRPSCTISGRIPGSDATSWDCIRRKRLNC